MKKIYYVEVITKVRNGYQVIADSEQEAIDKVEAKDGIIQTFYNIDTPEVISENAEFLEYGKEEHTEELE